MLYFLLFFIIIGFIFIIKWTYDLDNHYKWFNSLKPGDMILVEIFSNDCECFIEAMVVSEPFGKYIEAEISTDKKKGCQHCHKANNSCLYDVNVFHRNIVNKLPQ